MVDSTLKTEVNTTITVDNLKLALESMEFVENGSLFEKYFPAYNCFLAVDFDRNKLIYPDVIKGRDRNDGFDAPENFVVFECVNRLLDKGYRPEDIELEKEWHLGHDAKSGRADICVSYNGEMLFIIECNTVKKINKVALGKKKGLAPQAPRYSSYKTIMSAKTLDDLWC